MVAFLVAMMLAVWIVFPWSVMHRRIGVLMLAAWFVNVVLIEVASGIMIVWVVMMMMVVVTVSVIVIALMTVSVLVRHAPAGKLLE